MVGLLLISLGLTALTVFLHGVGTFQTVRLLAAKLEKKRHSYKPLSAELFIIRLVWILRIKNDYTPNETHSREKSD